ncbi:hypothetical protein [Bradyrhizobium sp. CCBAU 25360]|uniref:hypothetical protein n=1 Tax=Bradyrhizobium sp. CCBAU 25360 TaxID=858425 RepID=UPI00230603F4|nr:hypothetical protein [Bradyrhizobium sp. CCBAU 25360]
MARKKCRSGSPRFWQHDSRRSRKGAALPVRDGQQLGFAKLDSQEYEWLGYHLAVLVGAAVARVEYGLIRVGAKRERAAISYRISPASYAVREKELVVHRDLSVEEQAALERASSLLAYLAWIGATDHADDTNLIVNPARDGLKVVAIDFENAFGGDLSSIGIEIPPSPLLRLHSNRRRLEGVVRRIEGLKRSQIARRCRASGMSADAARRLVRSLCDRRKGLRSALEAEGLL